MSFCTITQRRLGAAMTALTAVVSTGCSTLQIDVDVYKGPLVNNEEVQRDQLVSMAMSAKTLMYTARNKLLDEYVKDWSAPGNRCGPQARSRPLTVFEIGEDSGSVVCGTLVKAEAKATEETQVRRNEEKPSHALRSVRQLNLVLHFYEPMAPAGIRKEILAVQEARSSYQQVSEALKNALEEAAAGRNRSGTPTIDQRRVDRATAFAHLRDALIDVHAGAESEFKRQSESKHRSGSKHQSGSKYLAVTSALIASSLSSRFLRERLELSGAINAVCGYQGSRSGPTTRLLLERCLIDKPTPMRESVRSSLLAVSRQSDNFEIADDINNFMNAVLEITSLQAAGFEAGRTEAGVDELATKYAFERDKWIGAGKPTRPDNEFLIAKDRAFDRLQHTLTDLASRMQFLATNLFLVDDAALQGLGLRGTLEAVANTLLVHADDLGRQRQFEEGQRGAAARERSAATTALLVEPAVVVRRIGDALNERVKAAQTAVKAAENADTAGKGLRDRRAVQESNVSTEVKAVQALAAAASSARVLHVLLGASPVPKNLREAIQDEATLRADGKALLQQLRSGGEGESFEAMRLQLLSEIDALLADRSSQRSQSRKSTTALVTARNYLAGPLAPMSKRPHPAKSRSARVDGFAAEITADAVRQQEDLKTANASLDRAKLALDQIDEQIKGLKPTVASELAALAKLTDAQKEISAVIKSVAEKVSQERVDAVTARRLLAAALKDRATTAAAADQAGLRRAAAEVESLPAVAALELPSDPTAARDTMDEYIAQLRYRWLEEVRNTGANGELAQRALAALEGARKMREDSIFLRPASTYLRSALPITALQSSTRSEWTNMLLGEAARTPRELWNSFRRVVDSSHDADAKAKTALDRAHWQNINAVRVAGAGNTNFAIAKDDVGNWYVKAMGADPVAMANTARRLALFNAGRGFDANLLRADDLRTQIDAGRKNGDDTIKQEAELTGITRDRTSAATSARSDTLALFKKNYDEQSLGHLKKLRQRLQADSPLVAVKKRVAAVMTGSDVPTAFDDLGDRELVKDTYGQALAAVQADGAENEPGKAIVAALVALDGTRTALRSALAEDKVATATALTKFENAKASVLLARNQLVQREADARTDAGTLASATSALKALPETATQQERTTAAKRQEALLIAYDAALGKVREAQETLTKAEALRTAAEGNLALAKTLVAKAGDEVESVFRKMIDETVAERLRVIAETETATKVVGEALTGGGPNGAAAAGGPAAK